LLAQPCREVMRSLRACLLGLIILSATVYSTKDSEDSEGLQLNPDEDNDEYVYNRTYADQQNSLQLAIFKNYNRNDRPVKVADNSLDVDIHLHVTHVSFNQKEQTMTVHGHMYMSWFDEFLGWDPKDYDGVSTTNVKKWQIWMPDVRVSNSINGIYSVHDISRNAHITLQTVSLDGGKTYTRAKVETYPTFSMKVGCIMDFSDYPYDDHACGVRLYTPRKMRQVRLNVYRGLPPTMFLSWSNATQKLTSGEFTIHRASNNISFYRFGEKENNSPITGNEVTKTWSIYNLYIFYRRHSATYFVTVALPLISSTIISLTSLLIKDVQFATLLNGLTFIIHSLFIREFSVICPVSVYLVPRAMMFHGFSLALTVFCFSFQLSLWILCSQTGAQTYIIDTYSKAYNALPVDPFPGFMTDFVKGLGDIRTRGWKRNMTVWRGEMCGLLSFVYLILFARAFLI
ncbi:hypothetical protein PMAYCL1PPCAC_30875, partial [Pristionchus mayeri]